MPCGSDHSQRRLAGQLWDSKHAVILVHEVATSATECQQPQRSLMGGREQGTCLPEMKVPGNLVKEVILISLPSPLLMSQRPALTLY